jgi:hypothetical protein
MTKLCVRVIFNKSAIVATPPAFGLNPMRPGILELQFGGRELFSAEFVLESMNSDPVRHVLLTSVWIRQGIACGCHKEG